MAGSGPVGDAGAAVQASCPPGWAGSLPAPLSADKPSTPLLWGVVVRGVAEVVWVQPGYDPAPA